MKYALIYAALLAFAKLASANHLLRVIEDNEYLIEDEIEVTWYEAEKICKDKSMNLVAIETKEKQEEIAKLLSENFFTSWMNQLHLWTSGSDKHQEKSFEWLSHSTIKFEYTNWAENEPKNTFGKEHCVVLSSGDFLWNVASCELKMGYICERRDDGTIKRAKEFERLRTIYLVNEEETKLSQAKKSLQEKIDGIEAEKERIQKDVASNLKLCEDKVFKLINEELKTTSLSYTLLSGGVEKSKKSKNDCIYKKLRELAAITESDGDVKVKNGESSPPHDCLSKETVKD